MQPISTEELVAYLAKKRPSDRAQAIDDLSDRDAEVAARLWLIQATAGYCREDVGEGEGGYNEDHEYFGEVANI